MTQQEIWDAWAPVESEWTQWVKPVLFAHLTDAVEISDGRGADETLALQARMGLKPSPLGGFGGLLPEAGRGFG
jgi:hypothetical protein